MVCFYEKLRTVQACSPGESLADRAITTTSVVRWVDAGGGGGKRVVMLFCKIRFYKRIQT